MIIRALASASLALSLASCVTTDDDAPALESAIQDLTPSDPLASLQAWHYGLIRAPQAWNLTTGSPSVLVAVLDSGRQPHPDLDAKWWGGYNFFDGYPDPTDRYTYHHGMHVAGTIGAIANNGIGGTGLCWGCQLEPVVVLQRGNGSSGQSAPGRTDLNGVMARAIRYAAGLPTDNGLGTIVQSGRRADVANISIGQSPITSVCDPRIQAAVNDATAAGTVVVAAAANIANGNPDANQYQWAHCANVIVVSAVDSAGNYEPYATRGAGVTIGAPGGSGGGPNGDQAGWGELIGCTDPAEPGPTGTHGVVSTWSTLAFAGTPCYRHWAGTSMATPHVSGTIGLMRSRNAALTPAQIRTILVATAPVLTKLGPPVLDAYAAVAASTFGVSLACESAYGQFDCTVTVDGGLAPLVATWTGVAYAGIGTHDAYGAHGTCTVGRTSQVRYNVTDGLGRAFVKTRSFLCRSTPQ